MYSCYTINCMLFKSSIQILTTRTDVQNYIDGLNYWVTANHLTFSSSNVNNLHAERIHPHSWNMKYWLQYHSVFIGPLIRHVWPVESQLTSTSICYWTSSTLQAQAVENSAHLYQVLINNWMPLSDNIIRSTMSWRNEVIHEWPQRGINQSAP